MRQPLATAATALVMLLATLAGGCARPSTACKGPENSVNICINGKRLQFTEEAQPHGHETGSIYAPVDVLAGRLGLDVRTWTTADGLTATVTVNRKPFAPAMAHGAKGIHVHNGHVYVPLREFAAAAGLKLELNAESLTAGFAK